MTGLLYTSRFEVAVGALARYDEWYAHHAADLIGVGFRAVHGYRSSVAPRALSNVYELPGVDVFGDAYARAREADELGRSVRPLLTPAELGVFAPLVGGTADLAAPGLCVADFDFGSGAPTGLDLAVAEALAGPGRGCALFESVAAPVAPAIEGRLRVVVSCPSPEDAFRSSDDVARVLSDYDPGVAVDVLTHRVSYPTAGQP
jgi:hypothetical protein